MSSGGPAPWSLQDHTTISAVDFSTFFNFGDIQLNIPLSAFDPTGRGDDDDDGGGGGGGGGDDDPHATMDTDFTDADDLEGKEHHMLSAGDILGMQFHDLSTIEQPRQHGRQHGQHHTMHHHNMMPPTPSSIDIPHSYTHNMEANILMGRFHNMRDEQMLFTPLVSPAVTPLDTNFVQHMPSFTIPEYFSPLTSPALDAHPHRTHMPNPHMARSYHSQSTSPIDPKDSPKINRKVNSRRRKSATSRSLARVVSESPSMKPQRKKTPQSLTSTLELVGALMQQPLTPSRQTSYKLGSGFYQSRDTSSNESVSPELLPDVLMPPPPRAAQSPGDPSSGEEDESALGEPATPASLMKIHKTNLPMEDIPPFAMDTSDFLNGDVERVMKDVGTRTESPKSPEDDQSAPTICIKTGSSNSNPKSGEQSRSPIEGDQTPSSSSGGKRVAKSNGHSGKHGGVSSSPALQSKISPSIKPLLPQGMNSEASTLLLKSNYQVIVEGNHKQLGFSYPAELSTNLTSKRTSHKIAEQGRRNRMNNALADIAALLPHNSGNGSDGSSSTPVTAAAAQASKASTVESAIEYIKELHKELSETKRKLAVAEEKLSGINLTE